ncbi:MULTISPECIES: calcium/sodium antiporter [Motilimonas]|uniref:Calcium/sodium antiporter n=1 Tax=Motilimonas cestriensis TaxID=2742685 RepID=A0ABS8WEK9_9GAMM|nr:MULTISPECIES: calcium/sodium antiporter [Motilimonas]MCE0555778.1 calcium/sodium antiporter [Motilimonas sp. E26]MCE2596066.1 calcium/sodium antiporter [Motilimonas cestriensis]
MEANILWLNVLILVVSLAALVWSADKFVFGAAAIARNLGISPLIIGLTIVAMGSSAPEMMVAASASLNGAPNTAIGNAIGSNITNITLVLGLTALLRPMLVASSTMRRELPMVMVTSLLAAWLLWDLELTRGEGTVLIIGFFATIGGLTWMALKNPNTNDPLVEELEDEIPSDIPFWKAAFWLVFGLGLLIYSSNELVGSAVVIAKHFGISDLVIGLTIIAIGTSLPELAACIASVLKKEGDLALGNIVGSNIFNILAVLAIPGILAPGTIDASAAGRDMYYMLGVTVLLLIVAGNGKIKEITRVEGGLLLACFIAYQVLLFYTM